MEGIPETMPDGSIFFKTGDYTLLVPVNDVTIEFISQILKGMKENSKKEMKKKAVTPVSDLIHLADAQTEQTKINIEKHVRGLGNEYVANYILEKTGEWFTTMDAKKIITKLYKDNGCKLDHGGLLSKSCACLKHLEKKGKIERGTVSKSWMKTDKKKEKPASSSTVVIDDGKIESTPTKEDIADATEILDIVYNQPGSDWTKDEEEMLRDNYDDVDKILRLKLIKGKTREDIEQKIEALGLVNKTIENTLTEDEEKPKKQPLKKKTEDLRSLVIKRAKERKKYAD
jgi:hypothetical protein